MNIFSKSANLSGDVCSVLFGSTAIMTLKPATVWICVILSVLVTVMFILFYNKIFAITFDEDFASATGIKSKLYNVLLAVIIAVIIVLAMNLVGALLVSALVVFPALTAMRVFKSFRAVTICSVIISVVCAALGIVISMIPKRGTPVGSTIVAVEIAVFAVFGLIGLITRKGVKA
jgi:zinc transport system permease protein